ncbi:MULTISPECIES: TspO/MBR family protein [unclassified Pedobacter]|uniref:TspO/MBR family protein n=1 Tax=unclassified Pedobacter TaxID=2628915 RepID=UPI0022474F50|nr:MULTISPECIES: TspO/MBR family protein [unclassified Pedobacter]MCX2429245.1 tryptophan-rich sensory protein [Pedobacter sp. GR22-10]MCX2583683.1 tryptophan-rich sensory protein [Pedobacter sp. MR22-3]
MKFKPLAFILSILITLSIGALGGYATAQSVRTWYPLLNKPAFNPPNWLFAPVWTSLYVLIGIAAYLVWVKRDRIVHFPRTVAIYFIQLILNLAWSFIFFYLHEIGFALAEIIVLLAVIILNAMMFYKIDKWAGLLFIPYILWVSFASFLTYNLFILN